MANIMREDVLDESFSIPSKRGKNDTGGYGVAEVVEDGLGFKLELVCQSLEYP